ncbi:MAG: alpha/beta fold hydrolase [Pseudomonadota bacterium]
MASEPNVPGPTALDLPLKLWIARMAHGVSPASLAQAQADWLVHLGVSPAKQAELAASAMRKVGTFLQAQSAAMLAAGAGVTPDAPKDKRFARPGWEQLPFSAIAQAFGAADQWWAEATRGVRGVSSHHEDITSFMARQWLDMLSPSNFLPTNPELLKETARTAGGNLYSGAVNWWRDFLEVQRGGDARGLEDFRPGEAVALTPGKVVMRNRLVELIQYEPATPVVDKEPVLIIPSWIMKFYILDLTPQDSLVRYLVEQGHTVFIVSWRNPGSEDAALGLDDYLQHGVFEALEAVQQALPGAQVHAMGYCLGGTLLAIAAALMGARRQHHLRTLSLLAAQVDFEAPGELGLFIDESQIAFLEDVMAEHGYLDGRQMAGAFQLINSKDLVWSKLVHEYLMGAHTPMTALRAWNADATRMPARMHSEYLRRLYLNNDLAEGRYRAFGEVVNLHDIRTPMFLLATERDHVSPWQSVYKLLRLASAPATFVLCSGGHNVGIVNPPDGPAASAQASYRVARFRPRAAPADPQPAMQVIPAEPGSWWPVWQQWLHKHSSGLVDAPMPAGLKVGGKPLEAPGEFVHQR